MKHARLLWGFFVLAGTCFGQGIPYFSNVFTSANSAPPGSQTTMFTVPFSTVTVCGAVPVGNPCTNTVVIYANAGMTVTAHNPITTDVHGKFNFWAPSGSYSYSLKSANGTLLGTYYFTLGGSGGTSVSFQHNGSAVANQNVVNFDDTTPAAPTGFVNVVFQNDSTGKWSAYVPIGGSSFSLTTTGTSGAATYASSILNIPDYTYTLTVPKVTALGTLTNDISGSAAKWATITASGVPGVGQVPVATSSTTASWQTISATGGLTGQTINCAPKAQTATTSASSMPVCDDGTTTTIAHPLGVSDGTGQGGTFNALEGTVGTLTPTAAHDIFYADATAHCLKYSANGAAFGCLGSGSGVSSIDTQTGAFTFGGTGVSHVGNAYTFSGSGGTTGVINPQSSPYNASNLPISYCNFTSGANVATCTSVTGWVSNQGGAWAPVPALPTATPTGATVPSTGTICDHVTVSGLTLTCLNSGGTAQNFNFTSQNFQTALIRTYTVKGYGASGQNIVTLTATDSSFANGMGARIVGAGAAGADLVCPKTTISGTSLTCLQSDGVTAQNIGTTIVVGTPAQVWHEDTLAMQNAVATGQNVLAPSGSYYLGGTVSLSSPQMLQGLGGNQSIFVATKDALTPIVLAGSGEMVSNLGVYAYDGFTSTSGALVSLCNTTNYCANDTIANLSLYGGWVQIIANNYTAVSWVRNNYGLNAKGIAVRVSNVTPYGDINWNDNQFVDCNTTTCNTAVGLQIDAADTESFSNNKFNEFLLDASITGANGIVEQQRFINNSFERAASSTGNNALKIIKAGSNAVKNIEFTGGEIGFFGIGGAVYVGAGTSDVSFSGVNVAATSSNNAPCFDVFATTFTLSGASTIFNCGSAAVQFESGSSGVVNGNTITGGSTYAIKALAGSTNLAITGNGLSSNTSGSLNIDSTLLVNTNRFTNNTCSPNACETDNVTPAPQTVSASLTATPNTAYVANGGAAVTFTMPAAPVVGDKVTTTGSSSFGMVVVPSGSQVLYSGANSSTGGGCGGGFSNTNRYDSLTWQYMAANNWTQIAGVPATVAATYQTEDTFAGTVGTNLTAHTDNCSHTWTSYNSITGDTNPGSALLNGSGGIAVSTGTAITVAEFLNSVTPSSANYTQTETFTVGSNPANVVMFARASSGAYTTYQCNAGSSGGGVVSLNITRHNSGSSTTINGSFSGVPNWTAGSTHTLSFAVSGSTPTTITLLLDGVNYMTGGPSSDGSPITAVGQGGMSISGASSVTETQYTLQ